MTQKPLYLSLMAAGMLALGACATAERSGSTETTQVAMADTSSDNAAQVVEAGLDPNEEVCRRVKQTTTRFTKKVCMTRQQWADMASNAKKNTSELQQRSFDPGRGS